MLYDGLFSLDLPSRLGPPVKVGWLDGVEHLIFAGRFHPRRAECALSSGVVLARCWEALKGLHPVEIVIRGGADDVLDLVIPSERYGEAPPPWPDLLPPAWTGQPCDFRLHALLHRPGLAAVIQVRYAPRCEPETGPLTGSVRLLWDVKPGEGQSFDSFEKQLSSQIIGELPALRQRIDGAGRHLSEEWIEGLERVFPDSSGVTWGRVVVLVGPGERFADMLSGFPNENLAQLPVMEAVARAGGRSWEALDANGVPGRVDRGGFIPVAEVIHGL